MLREKSCGALVVRRDEEDGKQYLLMIRHKLGGHRSFLFHSGVLLLHLFIARSAP